MSQIKLEAFINLDDYESLVSAAIADGRDTRKAALLRHAVKRQITAKAPTPNPYPIPDDAPTPEDVPLAAKTQQHIAQLLGHDALSALEQIPDMQLRMEVVGLIQAVAQQQAEEEQNNESPKDVLTRLARLVGWDSLNTLAC